MSKLDDRHLEGTFTRAGHEFELIRDRGMPRDFQWTARHRDGWQTEPGRRALVRREMCEYIDGLEAELEEDLAALRDGAA